jgi:hypothetical protein
MKKDDIGGSSSKQGEMGDGIIILKCLYRNRFGGCGLD